MMTHCWVCDDHGGLHFLQDVIIHHGNDLSVETIQWSKVGTGFHSVHAGYGHVVCGIKNSSLYLRRGITFKMPMGVEWVKHVCDVVDIMVGKHYIVRKSSNGSLYSTKTSHIYDLVLDWAFVPPYQDSNSNAHDHQAVDNSDRLYSITSNGEVFCCDLLASDLQWRLIMGPPVVGRSGGWIPSIRFWKSQEDVDKEWIISMVSPGLRSIWCQKDKSNEVWQLVIGSMMTNVNWMKSALPLTNEETIVSLSASKSTEDGLYLILQERGCYKLVSFTLNMEDCGAIQIPLPVRYPCNSLAISITEEVEITPVSLRTEDTASNVLVVGNQLTRKRGSAHTDLPPPLPPPPPPKRLKEWRETSSLTDGVDMTFNKYFLTEQVSRL